jgi:curli biogenesis system outer membrane secretion channel CsgG
MNNKFFSVLILTSLLMSCGHVESPSSKSSVSQASITPVEKFDLSNYHGAKLSVKVYPWRITDVDLAKFPILNNYHIGWGVSNRLTDILFDVGRFKFYEEKQEIAAAQMQSCQTSNTCKNNAHSENVDYIIYPEVYHLGIEKNTDINGFDTTNRQTIEIGIQIKLVNAQTGEIKAAGSYIGQKLLTSEGDIINNPSIDFSESALGKATDAAIKGAIAKMLKRLDGGGVEIPTTGADKPTTAIKNPADESYRTFNAGAMPTGTATPSNPYSEKRLALVIGNAKYQISKISLANAGHDADDISTELKKLGFDVSLYTNLSKREMEEAIDGFDKKLKAAGHGSVALFYYAGHAAEVQGINYMFPVDFQGNGGEDQVDMEAVPVHRFVKQIKTAGNYLNIIVLDACRNNPYNPEQRAFNTKTNRLATMNYDIDGMFYSYATAAGETASDGVGENGLFTGNLLKFIPDSTLKIHDVFNKVGEAVSHANKDQIPWVNSSFHGVFYFNPPAK